MAANVVESATCKKLSSLRVVELKQELDKRGLEKTGVKAALIDRLKKCLEDEGLDPEAFKVDPCDVKKSPAKSCAAKEKEEDEEIEEEMTAELMGENGDFVEEEEEEEEEEVEEEPIYVDMMDEEEEVEEVEEVEEEVGEPDQVDDGVTETCTSAEEESVATDLEPHVVAGEEKCAAEDEEESCGVKATDDQLMSELDAAIGEGLQQGAGDAKGLQQGAGAGQSGATDNSDSETGDVDTDVLDTSLMDTGITPTDATQADATCTDSVKVKVTGTPVSLKPTVKSTPKTTPKVAVKPAVKPSPKSAAKPAAKLAAKPAAKPAVKPTLKLLPSTTAMLARTAAQSAGGKTPTQAKVAPKSTTPSTGKVAGGKVAPAATVKAVGAKPKGAVGKVITKTTPAKGATATAVKSAKSTAAVSKGTAGKTANRAAVKGAGGGAVKEAVSTPDIALGAPGTAVTQTGSAAAVADAAEEALTDGADDCSLLIVHADESLVDVDSDIVKTAVTVADVEIQELATGEDEEVIVLDDVANEATTGDTTGKALETGESEKREQAAASPSATEGSKAKSVSAKDAKSASKPAVKDTKGSGSSAATNAGSRNLWVSGLSSSTRATDLKTVFSKYGKVAGAKVVTNVRSPGSRCYGFVTMSTPDEASKCIQHLHRTELHGRMISVERAKSDPASQAKAAAAKKLQTAKKVGSGTAEAAAAAKKSVEKTATKDDRSRAHPAGRGRGALKSASSPKPGAKERASSSSTSGRAPKSNTDLKKDDVLTFDQIKMERERERLNERAARLRAEERRKDHEMESVRRRQHDIDRQQREEHSRLDREKEQLRMEKIRFEREKEESERTKMRVEREQRDVQRRDLQRHKPDRPEDVRRPVKRSFERPAVVNSRDDRWNGDAAKRPANSDNVSRYNSGYAQQGQTANRFGSFNDQRSSGIYDRHTDRHTDRFDRRDGAGQSTMPVASRYTDRRGDAAVRREPVRDRDDRAKYSRYEERPSHASAARLHHSTSAAPLPAHRPATRASPGRRSADLRVDRSAVGSGGAPASHRSERYQEVGMSKGGYSESRHSVAASRDSGWHNLAMQDERKGRSSYGVTQGSMSWESGHAGGVQPSVRSDRWPPSASGQEMMAHSGVVSSSGLGPSAMGQQSSGSGFIASGGAVMSGSGGGTGGRQDMRYDAYKNLSGGNVRRY